MTAIEELAGQVAERAGDRTVACAESCTGGLLVQALAAQDGASDWLRGGLVAYQTLVKRSLLGVDAENVVSEEAAREMARGASRLFDADIAVATTGVAGPERMDGIEPGTVIIAWAVGEDVSSETLRLDGEPAAVCHGAVAEALRGLRRALD